MVACYHWSVVLYDTVTCYSTIHTFSTHQLLMCLVVGTTPVEERVASVHLEGPVCCDSLPIPSAICPACLSYTSPLVSYYSLQ